MAISEFKQAVYNSLSTDEERRIIDRFYEMSNADFLKSYRHNIGELVDRFDRTRLWPHQKGNISYRQERLTKKTPPKGFITTLPAGAGKTEIFTQTVLENAIEVTDEHEKVRLITPPTVILVPSEDLIKQTYSELKEREPNLLVGVDYGKEKDIKPLTITTYNTFADKVEEGKIKPGDVKLMVMDEAHRGLSDMRFAVFSRFLNNTLIDAYSASPAFDAMKNLYELLGKDSVIPGPSDRELTTMGFLAECHNVLMRVSVKTDDLPEALRNHPERYNDFLEELKIQAAKEFYLTYADEKTGQRAFGKPAIGFARYVRHAQRAAEVFDEAFKECGSKDKAAAKLLEKYSHPTQVLSRSMGDSEVDAAFNRILPKHKRTADEGENLITFTTKMAREGTNIPQWKVAIGIQTPNSSVDQVQTRGRARRKTGDELSFVLDVFVEEDGKIRGKPKFYYEAIDDPSIVRGVITVTPEKEKIDEIAAEVLEFKNKQEMKGLVLGDGDAAKKYGGQFDKLWNQIEGHTKTEEKKKKPEPYILDGEPVACKIVTRYPVEENGSNNGEKKQIKITETRVSAKAVDQFRAALGIPGQISAKWRDEQSFKDAVIGRKIPADREDNRPITEAMRINSERAEFYEGKFNALMDRAQKYFDGSKGKKHVVPFMVAGQPVRMEERLDDAGNMILAFHADGIQAFKQALDVAPTQGLRFSDKEQFEAAVFEVADGKDKTKKMKEFDQLVPRLEAMWTAAKKEYTKTHKPGLRSVIPFGDGHVEAANCYVGKGQALEFCLDRSAIAIARRVLGIAPITFDPKTIKWDKGITAVEQITKLRDNGLYENRPDHYLAKIEFARHIGVAAQKNERFTELWDRIQKAYTENDNTSPAIDGYLVECGTFRSGNSPVFCVSTHSANWFKEKIGVAEAKSDEWLTKTEVMQELLIGHKHHRFNELWHEIERQYEKNRGRVVIDEHPVACAVKRNVSKQTVHVNKAEVEWIRKKLGISPRKTEEWLARYEFAELIGDSKTDSFNQLWDNIAKLKTEKPDEAPVINGHVVDCGTKKSQSGEFFCLHKDEAKWFKQELERIKSEQALTEEWKTKSDFAREIGCRSNDPDYDQLWEKAKKQYQAAPTKPVVIDKHTLNCCEKRSGNATIFVVHESEKEWFQEKLGIAPEKTNEWKTKLEVAEALGISPTKNKRFVELWDRIKSVYEIAPKKPVIIEGHTLNVQYRRAHTQTPVCLHADDIGWISSQLGLSHDDASWGKKVEGAKGVKSRSIKPDSDDLRKRGGRSKE